MAGGTWNRIPICFLTLLSQCVYIRQKGPAHTCHEISYLQVHESALDENHFQTRIGQPNGITTEVCRTELVFYKSQCQIHHPHLCPIPDLYLAQQ